jgi:ElaB/YqjD/DUF883 family membrane-anchored ribosome-binding protein
MSATVKGNSELEKNSELEAIMSDIASLRLDLGALAEHFKTSPIDGATNAARDAAARVSGEARRIYDNLAEQGQSSMKALGRHVEEQPVMTLLVAFAIGLIGGRLLSR